MCINEQNKHQPVLIEVPRGYSMPTSIKFMESSKNPLILYKSFHIIFFFVKILDMNWEKFRGLGELTWNDLSIFGIKYNVNQH